MRIKDEDGETYTYGYHDFTWNEGGPLLIFDAGILGKDGVRQMVLKAKFQNCRAILNIVEVEDESEG